MDTMARVARLFKADLNGIMDLFEDKGLLLKQSFRDMEEAMLDEASQLKEMELLRRRLKNENERYIRQLEQLEDDLDVALKKDKNDIARILIKKIKTLDVCVQELNLNIETFENRIKIHTSQLDEQRHVFAHLRLKAKTYQGDKKIDERDINIFELNHHGITCESSKEEIEWELIQRKEILKGGEQ